MPFVLKGKCPFRVEEKFCKKYSKKCESLSNIKFMKRFCPLAVAGFSFSL